MTPRAVRGLLLDVVTVLWSLVLPIFAALALVGPQLTEVVFGTKWAQAAQLLPWLSAIVFGWLTLYLPAIALRAKGDLGAAIRLLTIPTLLDLGIMVALVPIDLRWALMGMALRVAGTLPLVGRVMRRRLGISAASILGRWTSPLLGTIAMGVCIEALRPFVGARWAGLFLLIAAGALAYGLVIATDVLRREGHLRRALQDIRRLDAFLTADAGTDASGGQTRGSAETGRPVTIDALESARTATPSDERRRPGEKPSATSPDLHEDRLCAR